jgi:hypothetical protein
VDGILVSADAMHAQTGHATYLHGRGAGLLVGLKASQPTVQSAELNRLRRENAEL